MIWTQWLRCETEKVSDFEIQLFAGKPNGLGTTFIYIIKVVIHLQGHGNTFGSSVKHGAGIFPFYLWVAREIRDQGTEPPARLILTALGVGPLRENVGVDAEASAIGGDTVLLWLKKNLA
jgi:hypothetical protein